MSESICPVCGGSATIRRMTEAFGQGDDLLVIEGIPMIACRACHEQYVTAQTLAKIDQLREQGHQKSRVVAVEQYAS